MSICGASAPIVWALGRGLGLPRQRIKAISAASALHDIGKLAIPDSILTKRGPLDESERRIVETHPTVGARLLAGSPSPWVALAREVALTHHENWDGSGYPSGLVGTDIPLTGRIVRLADQYDALRSERVYKPAFSHARALEVIYEGDGRTLPSHFDPELLDILRSAHGDFDRIFASCRD